MKSLFATCLLIALTQINGHKLHQRSAIRNEDDDLDSLMEKYDNNSSPSKAKAPVKSQAGGPSIAQVSEMEFKILSGQNLGLSSTKADEDDAIDEVLQKYASTKGGDKALTKNDAQEAAIELMESKGKANSMDSMN